MTKPVAKSKTHCPNCHSTQSFVPKTETWMDQGQEQIRVFIRCNKCHWEKDGYRGLAKVWRARKDMAELRAASLRRPVNQITIDRISERHR